MLNKVILHGRIPKFENAVRYFEASDTQKAGAYVKLSVSRNYKLEGDKYPPEDLIDIRLHGQLAETFNKYTNLGDEIVVEGSIWRAKNTEDKDGNIVYGQLYVNVDRYDFVGSSSEKTDDARTAEPAKHTTAAAAPTKKPTTRSAIRLNVKRAPAFQK